MTEIRRVVVTGLGVVAPNGVGLANFDGALREGRSGIRFQEKLAELKFACQVAGVPTGTDEVFEEYFDEDEQKAMNSNHRFGCIAALDAWTDAGFERPARDDAHVNWDAGAIVGTGIGGLDTAGDKLIPMTDAGKVRRLGSTIVEQIMGSGASARLAGLLALGNQVTSNSSACSTGTEAVIEGVQRIRNGLAERMLVGGSEGSSHYIWAGFDAMHVLSREFNNDPGRASRPMSASAGGFVPAAGAGVLMLESLQSAESRGARIYAEMLGGAVNCGGHRGGGSMTSPNPTSVQRCIRAALQDAGVQASEIDAINGHLTATGADPAEVNNWSHALERGPGDFPWITSTKSMIGHGLGAAGGMEAVATVSMLHGGYVHASINSEDVHPKIMPFASHIPQETKVLPELRTMAKASFGFGDVNSCLVLRKWVAQDGVTANRRES